MMTVEQQQSHPVSVAEVGGSVSTDYHRAVTLYNAGCEAGGAGRPLQEQALDSVERALAGAPGALELYPLKASILGELGRHDEAAAAAETLLALCRRADTPDTREHRALGWLSLAGVALGQDRLSQAEALYRQSVQAARDHDESQHLEDAWDGLATVLRLLGEPVKAREATLAGIAELEERGVGHDLLDGQLEVINEEAGEPVLMARGGSSGRDNG
jgi:tetratricopeptide (TPR) repeat protein